MMKVSVDFDVCASTGACMQVCPEVFEVRSDGYLYVLQEEPDRAVPRQGARSGRSLPHRRDHPRGMTPAAAPSAGHRP
jgi:ferredoxin